MPIDSKLQLSPDEMRRLGYRIIDQIVEHLESLPDLPAVKLSSRATLEAKLREPIPEQPSEVNLLLDQLQRDVFSSISHVTHPRFFAFIPEPSNFVGAMADALVAGINPFAGTW